MRIVRYEVERFTGTDKEHTTGTNLFPSNGETQNPIVDRRAAFNSALSLIRYLKEAEDEEIITHKSKYALGNPDEDRIEVYVKVVYDIDGIEASEIIHGLPLNAIIDNLEEETDCYDDNKYDTGGELYTLDVSPIGYGYKRMLKDIYELYAEDLREQADEKYRTENE